MEDIMVCCICLATDAKLCNIFKYGLNTAYENLTGMQVPQNCEGFPHQICSYCSALLIKCLVFKEKCKNSREVIEYALVHNDMVAIDILSTLPKQPHNLTISTTTNMNIDVTVVEVENSIKQENITNDNSISFTDDYNDVDNDNEYKYNADVSDDEPLSKKVTKKGKKSRLNDFDNCDVDISDNNTNDDGIDNIDVIILTKEQQIAEIQSRKHSENYLNSFYKCQKCFKGFITSSTFRNHMARHDYSNGDYACEICDTRWPDARSLRGHTVNSHERKFVCKLCKHVSKSSHSAKEHSKWHNGVTYDCNICGASFRKSTSHLTHIRLQHPTNHACDLCGESFIGEYGLKMHKKKAHKDSEYIKKELCCISCDIQFQNKDALKQHADRSENCDPNLRACVQCGKSFTTEELLKEHRKLHHKFDNVKCNECNRTFSQGRSLTVHYQRVHLGVNLRRPKQQYTSTAICEICGIKCTSKATLIYHQRIHTGEKPYQCSQCPKRFSILQRLQIHIRTHTGERPFKCSICPKAFKHKAALNRHDRVHTGLKPYTCPHCNKTFSQSNSMKIHVRTVHLKLPTPYRNKRQKLE